jgi:uncharacterized protein
MWSSCLYIAAADWNCEAMSREFPDFIDPWKAADGRRSFQGTMPLKRLQRLESMLAPAENGQSDVKLARKDVAFSVRFGYDEQGLVTIRINVNGSLPLVCQRSLEPYQEKIDRSSLLVVIEQISDQDDVPESYDPVLVENRRLAIQDIVEEELLLAIPQVPRNPEVGEIELSTDGEVTVPSKAGKEQSHKPFAGLAGLMKADIKD